MQYRNLNLEKLQAFAPERKLIDKENIYNTFLGLGDAFQKGADAHTLNEIYQLSPDEQQRKMAEYRAYKGDFSGFDNIEQAKLRQAEMNALKEQQRIDKENENAIVQRNKEHSYNALRREHNVLTNELLNNMNKFNRDNSNSPYKKVNNQEVQLRFLKEQDTTGLLQRFLTNLTEKEKLEFEPKHVNIKPENIFWLEKSDRAETKTAETKTAETKTAETKTAETKTESSSENDFVVYKDYTFDTDSNKQNYIFNDNWKASKDGLTDDQKKILKDYALKNIASFNDNIISDDLSDNVKVKLKDIGLSFITKADVNDLKNKAIVKEKNKTIVERLKNADFRDKEHGESDETYINQMKTFSEQNTKFKELYEKTINDVNNEYKQQRN